MSPLVPAVSVVVCAYTEDRWTDIVAAIASVHAQTVPAHEVLLVVDHNPVLATRARGGLAGVTVLENTHRNGLSGARNTGFAAAGGEIVAFLDDDATAHPDWLEQLLPAYRDPTVMAVGGSAFPVWTSSGRPAFLPIGPAGGGAGELDWVVGCTYTGLPVRTATVRNLMGCNMSFRREVFGLTGGFTEGIGRIGSTPLGCEETELCIQLRRHSPPAAILFEPRATVDHHVHPARTRWSYLRRRCWSEGVSKSMVARLADPGTALSTERAYLARVLPSALLRQVSRGLRGHRGGWSGALAIVLAVLWTTAGYLVGSLRHRGGIAIRRDQARPEPDADAIYVTEFDVRHGPEQVRVPDPGGRRYRQAQVLLRDGRRTVDVIRLPVRDGMLDVAGRTRPALTTESDEPDRRLSPSPSVSIVVPTVDRPDALTRCVKSLLGTGYPDLEVLVVDNRPDPAERARWQEFVATDPRIRYLTEPRRGVSFARNTGLAAARGEYVGFVDDDIEVDHWWLHNLTAELADPGTDCVTSLVLPAHLDARAQRAFEEFKGFGQGARRRRFGPGLWEREPGHVLTPGRFGPGGCALWRRSALERLGGFDPLLGPGTPSRAGEDLYLFLRLTREGGCVTYAPDAVAWHEHGTEWPELRTRIRGYGVGLTAMLLLHLLRRPGDLIQMARVLPERLRRVVLPGSGRAGQEAAPGSSRTRGLALDQLRGLACGPVALARSVRHERRTRAAEAPAVRAR
ncbi:MAG TPA: glycosyltransferase family 2 protein [Pseudonocardiaceae bacterium]